MDEDDKYNGQNRFLDWLEGHGAARKVVRAVAFVQRVWHLHIDRYRLWDETIYRFCTWVVVILVSLSLATGVRSGWRYFRHHEETRAQAQAQAFLTRGDYRNASLSASRALSFNPNNVPACRVMAELADLQHSPSVLDWLSQVERNQPTLENKLQLAAAGLRYQPPPYSFTSQILQELAPFASNNADYQVVAAKLAVNLNHVTDAEAHFSAAFRLDPENQYARMSAALLQLLSTNHEVQTAARVTLVSLQTNYTFSLIALRGLVADREAHRDLGHAEILSDQLVRHPQAILADRLQNLDILRRLHSPKFPARLQAVEALAMTNVEAVVEVSGWMRASGLAAENLHWMMNFPNSMLDLPQIEVNRAQGYLLTSNWTRLREVASQGDWGDLEYLRFALVSHACAQLDQPELADSNWQAAMKDAGSKLEDMVKLLELAESWRLNHEREQLLLQMVRDFPNDRWVQKLVGIYIDNGNTLGLHQLYGILIEYYPTNTVCQNNLAATEMLLKINLDAAYEMSNEAYAKDPGNPNVAATYAYGLHLQDRDIQGLAALKSLPKEKLELPNVALYYGVLLASVGKKGEALPPLELAQANGRFLPEEKQLLRAALDQAKIPKP